MARLSPAVQRTAYAGAAIRAPGHAGAIRGAMMRAPDSPNAAEPNSLSQALVSACVGMWWVLRVWRLLQRWRRERDLNPRGGLTPPTRLAGEHFRPLSHPSEWLGSI